MRSETEIHIPKPIFNAVRDGKFTYLNLEHKYKIGFIRLKSTFKNSPIEIWIRITEVKKEGVTWKTDFIIEAPEAKLTTTFKMQTDYQQNYE